MNVKEAIEDLEEFNAVLQEIASLRISNWRDREYSAKFTRVDATCEWDIQGDLPDDETLQAAVGKLRLFGQDNDRLSIGRISALYRTLHQRQLLPELHEVTFQELRGRLHALEEQNTLLGVGKQLLKRWQLMDIVTYGSFMHRERTKARVYRYWTTQQAFAVVRFLYIDTTLRSLHLYEEMAAVNAQAIAHLQGRPNVQFVAGSAQQGRAVRKIQDHLLDTLLKTPLQMHVPAERMIATPRLDGRTNFRVTMTEHDYQSGTPAGPRVF